jgi:peptidoglycan/xylan/chitin deacetylase (PgdA/CDA1 family)
MRAISLMFHDVFDPRTPPTANPERRTSLYTLEYARFRDHLQAIRRERGVETIDSFRSWGAEVPVFLTFDDGEASAYTLSAGALERNDWRGHFFVTTDWIGQPGFLNPVQIRELRKRGHVIGSHSRSHPSRMSHLGDEELARQWSQSCAVLSEILGERVVVASVPGGYYSKKVGRAATAAGIEVLFTSEPTTSVSTLNQCLILGRYCIQRQTRARVSGAIADGRFGPRWQQTLLWNIKKGIKAVSWQSYSSIRRFLLSRRQAS